MSKKEYDEKIIYCDGGMNSLTTTEAWGSVVDNNSNCLIRKYRKKLRKDFPDVIIKKVILPVGKRYIIVSKFNDVSSQQNNGAELLAMMLALKISEYNEITNTINSDSQLVIDYWSKGQVNSKTKAKMDPDKYKYIVECSKLRQKYNLNKGKIIKISGKYNKADLGFHK